MSLLNYIVAINKGSINCVQTCDLTDRAIPMLRRDIQINKDLYCVLSPLRPTLPNETSQAGLISHPDHAGRGSSLSPGHNSAITESQSHE